MPIAAAVSFGSFGDIVTIIQLVVQLIDALGDITGAPTEIEALVDNLNGYMLVLPLMENVLLNPDSHFELETRSRIEERLKRCKDTLLSLQHNVNAFAVRVQPRAGLRTILAYVAAVRWRLFGGKKQVAALQARLDKQLSLMQMCLGISQSIGQRALHGAAERARLHTEELLLTMHARPRPVASGAAIFLIGEILATIQRGLELTELLGYSTCSPTKILALVADLNHYMLFLSRMERILLRSDSHFERETLSCVKEPFKRCKDTLLAIQREVKAFALVVQPHGRLRRFRAYFGSLRWRLLSTRKLVAGLHSRLEAQFFLMQLRLRISQRPVSSSASAPFDRAGALP